METLTRAPFVFFSNRLYNPALRQPDDLDWLSRFAVCLSNGYEAFEKEERPRNGLVFVYIWFDGFYEKESAPDHPVMRLYPGMAELFGTVRSRPDWLLNPDNPLQGNGAVQPAFFYDFANPELRRGLIGLIRKRLDRVGYRGVFFDYIGGWALPEEVRALWKRRHPKMPYEDAALAFLRELRRGIPGLKVFGNQTYRLPLAFYDTIDFDLTESHATSFVWGKEAQIEVAGKGPQKIIETFYRPWDGASGYHAISQARRQRQAQRPTVRVFDLNYLQPRYGREVGRSGDREFVPSTDRAAIFYGYALAKLTDTDAFASDWYCPGFGRDEIYFADLGKPLDTSWREEDGAIVRHFQKGIVAATRGAADGRLPLDPRRPVHDLYERRDVPSGTRQATIPATVSAATGQSYPAARVYVYRKEKRR